MRRDTFLKSMAALAASSSLPISALAAGMNVKMMIPANPGGGWDGTGRALGKALLEAKVAETVTYENKGGAAGALGLAQFVNASKGDPNAIMIMGAVMLGGIITGKPPVSLSVATPLVPRNGTVSGMTVLDGPDNYTSRCGGRQAPDAVYKYVLAAQANVTFSLDNPGTDFPAIITLRNDCEEPTSAITCAGNFANPVPSITLNNADPGEYYIFIDGGGPERWVSSGNPIAFPASPDNFQAQHADLMAAGWGDGGNDAFDQFGTTFLTYNGAEQQLDVSIGERQVAVNGYNFTITSD
jgi:hypothetical protein